MSVMDSLVNGMKRWTLCAFILVYSFSFSAARAAPPPPELDVLVKGLDVKAEWSASPGATGYRLYYAPFPFAGEHTIQSADMGTARKYDITLGKSAAYYAAVTARDTSGESPFSNIVLVRISDGSDCAANALSRCITVTDCTDAGGDWIDDELWDERACGSLSITDVKKQDGARIASADESVVLDIGPGDLPQDQSITLRSFPGMGSLGVHDFGPDGLQFNSPVPITLRIDLEESELLRAKPSAAASTTGMIPLLDLLSVDEHGNAEMLDNVIIENDPANPNQVIVKAEIEHFSKVVVEAPAEFVVVRANYESEQFVDTQFTVQLTLDTAIAKRSMFEYDAFWFENITSTASGRVLQRPDMNTELARLLRGGVVIARTPVVNANLNYACASQPGSGHIQLKLDMKAEGWAPTALAVLFSMDSFRESQVLQLQLPVNCIAKSVEPTSGCTDPGAINYDPLATINDGSCQFPQQDIVDFTLTPTTINYVHTYGTSSCPQNVGSFEVRNSTNKPLIFTVAPPPGLPITVNSNGFSLGANESRSVAASFTCGMPYQVNGDIAVSARFADSAQQVTKKVRVSGNVVGAP